MKRFGMKKPSQKIQFFTLSVPKVQYINHIIYL